MQTSQLLKDETKVRKFDERIRKPQGKERERMEERRLFTIGHILQKPIKNQEKFSKYDIQNQNVVS